MNSGMQYLNARISEAGGARFWFHALRNCFITVANRDLMLPVSLTKSLVNHARPQDVTEGYAADGAASQRRRPHRRANSCGRADAGGCLAGGERGNRSCTGRVLTGGSIAEPAQDSVRESAIGINVDKRIPAARR